MTSTAAIVIRDIHHYGDDLTVPEAVARLRDGGQVTVTVTDPAPPEGDPRGNPRHGFDITVRPALGGQPELPPEVFWEARSFETPDSAALFAEALALASQLAACAGPASGQSALAHVRGRFERGDRVALEHTGDPHTRLRPGDQGTVTRYHAGLGQLDVNWDSGSTLSMLLDEGDRVRLIAPAPGEAGKEPGR